MGLERAATSLRKEGMVKQLKQSNEPTKTDADHVRKLDLNIGLIHHIATTIIRNEIIYDSSEKNIALRYISTV